MADINKQRVSNKFNKKVMVKKTFEEKLREAIYPVTIKKATQEHVLLWEEQLAILIQTERLLKSRFDIDGRAVAITLACQMLINQIEENDGK